MSFRYILFEDGKQMKTEKPTLIESVPHSKSDVDLTLVIPAYNEENRLPKMMTETIEVKLGIITHEVFWSIYEKKQWY